MKRFFLICFVLNFIFAQVAFFPSDRSFFNSSLAYNEAFGSTKHLLHDLKPFQISFLKKQFNKESKHKYIYSSEWQSSKEFDILPKSLFPSSKDSLSHFINWKSGKNAFYTELNLFAESINKEGNAISGAYEYRLIGQITEKFHFMALNRQISFLSNKELSLTHSRFSKGSYFDEQSLLNNNVSSSDYNEAYAVYQLNDESYFLIGKLPWELGFGESGKFILNGNQINPFTSVAFNLSFWRINYTAIHGSLLATELISINTDSLTNSAYSYRNIPDKFLVSHRFEIDASPNLKFHYNEMVIYGNRAMDLSYVNPFSFLRSQEHEQVDRDNAIITLGMKYRIPKYHIMTYHDIILDEFRLEEMLSYFNSDDHWFGNKQGILNGITWANHNVQLWFEHVSIAPYVYSHKFAVNRYTHNTQPVGYSTGPNSKVLFFKARYLVNEQFMINSSFKYSEKGHNLDPSESVNWNVGGDIFHGDDSRFKDTRKFLEGRKAIDNEFKLDLKYQPSYHYSFELNYSNSKLNGSFFQLFSMMSL